MCVFFVGFGYSRAGDTSDITYKPQGYGAFEVGQIGSGYFRELGQTILPISHIWQQRAYGNFGFDVLIKEHLEFNIRGEGWLVYSTPQVGSEPQTLQTRNFFFLKTANAAYSFLNSEQYGLQLQIGYFPFKYNPDVRNLGEYLFRANAYPLLVYSDFDYPQADLLGAHVKFAYQMPDLLRLQNDLLVHSEIYSIPVQDWSLSDVFSASLFDAVTIGGGISFCNLFSVYQGTYPSQWYDQNLNPDPKNPSLIMLKNAAGTDSAVFDWKSTNVMARCSFDPKKFIHTDLLGKNDLILYGEADFMGLKNYPLYFTDLRDRTFYSVGFNVPGFKIFDVINGEIEYCRDTNSFSNEFLFQTTPDISPRPLVNGASLIKIKRNQLRLSVYIKKTILDGHVGFIAQCARDHKKLNFYYFKRDYMSFIETLPSTQDWWWVFKTEFNF